jgi:hypothetical protein
MQVASVSAGGPHQSSKLGLPLTIATGAALLFTAFALWGFWTNFVEAAGVDFISFWAAGRLVLAGHPAAAYDISLHRSVEQAIVPHVGLLPFPYPPPFLIFVTPFALISFRWAFVAWIAITATFYAVTARRFTPLSYAFANPPVLVDFMIGQTGFLTAGILLGGLALLPSAPFAGGAILGLLLIKPQLAALLPVALIAGREWRAVAGGIVSVIIALAIALELFGIASYRGFIEILPHYVGYMRHNSWNWVELASPFAFLRYVGVQPVPALIVHASLAACAALLTALAWARNWPEKVAILATATLLISPYLLTYDAPLLIIPAALFIKQKRWSIVLLLWLLCALPVAHFYRLYEGPNTIPVAAILSIALLSSANLKRRTGEVRASGEGLQAI